MDIQILPGKLRGSLCAIPSKSQAHRILICAAFSDSPTVLVCPQTNEDIEATADCLRALGANIRRTENGYNITPADSIPLSAELNCRESGSTLRFMLPVAAALGVDATFLMAGRLPQRPLSPLWEEMQRMGCVLTRTTKNSIRCQGKLMPGHYTIDGGVSSQFITGLLLALSLVPGASQIEITGKLESAPYIKMTQQVLKQFGANTDTLHISGQRPLHTPGNITVEGDWSNGAFFLAANKLGSKLQIQGLNHDSAQGDRVCSSILDTITREHATIDCTDIPDLVPILSVAAAYYNGAVFNGIERLRLKESDRVSAVTHMLGAMGIQAKATTHTLQISPGLFTGGTIDAMNDHRIAMAAAIAATVSMEPVTILGAECVKKSYPTFWEEFRRLGGQYEQYIR